VTIVVLATVATVGTHVIIPMAIVAFRTTVTTVAAAVVTAAATAKGENLRDLHTPPLYYFPRTFCF
jgi:uncharacterized oligopeptide transporter (OPT) family protein